ncbi:cytochrome bd-I oxidase subunit CydX [Collimonas sp.]|jgi:cyd operon protein YbgT|uniref:cytochrome bd-I oxidase subunit CydX n=1 Tax=Collimonas sp. TaxID=1963772 RepID=UPI0037C03763
MWYFAWILGIGLALAFGIINVMWLEANYAFGSHDEETTRERFERAAAEHEEAKTRKK